MGKLLIQLCLGVIACVVSVANAADKNCADKLVVTRFAPSPTGKLHIGGARTALFNYLYAQRLGGKFVLRIEDTDRERSKAEHVDSILASLKWLNIPYEGQPVIQSERIERHVEVAKQLVEAGLAYYCYLSPEELETMRKSGRKIESPWRDRDPKLAPKGVAPVIRLKAPREGLTVVKDLVLGTVRFQNQVLDDMILVRSDGNPTYNFAVVVDDHDMGITHIIRGVDHLTNAARQTQVYQALNWELPAFAHIPLIHGTDGKKLSKRDGALGAEDFRTMGYLPEAIVNYLTRLGWGHKNDEIFDVEHAIKHFDIVKASQSPARLDFAKLGSVNREYMRKASDEDLVAIIREIIPAEVVADVEAIDGWTKILALMPELKVRASSLGELFEYTRFIWGPVGVATNAKEQLDGDAKTALADVLPRLKELKTWDATSVAGVVGKDAAQAVRVATTGGEVGAPLWRVLEVLGQEETVTRINNAL